MNKNIIKYVVVAIIAIIPMVSFAQTPSTGESSSSGSPSTGDSSSSMAPSTGNSSSTAVPSTGNSSSTAVPSTGGSVSTAVPSTGESTSTAVPPSNNGGGSSSSGSHSSSGSYVGGVSYSCNFITSYMNRGANNDASQVTKLQNFLKNNQKFDVEINGIFDEKTENAIKAFQTKYAETIMAPWGITQPTGRVYITTLKKINQIACNQPLVLNTNELATINSYKNRKAQPETVSTVIVTPRTASTSIEINNDKVQPGSEAIGSVEKGTENTASVTKASILERFWNFMIFLFR